MKYLILSAILFCGINLFAQNSMYDVCPIKNSSEIPESKVYQKDGKQIDLKNYISSTPTVLVFYRGGWCGYCSKHLSSLENSLSEFDSLGYNLLAISPDDYSKVDSTQIEDGLPSFEILSDKDANAIKNFGLAWEVDDMTYDKYREKYDIDLEWWSNSTHHLLPVPAVFIIKEGKIEYQHVDPEYSNRLSAELIIAFIKSLSI